VITIGITGAAGFLGSYVRRRLPTLGAFRVRALTRTQAVAPEAESTCLTWMQGDLNHPADCAKFVYGLDVVIHLAHTNTPLTSDKHLPGDAQLNLIPTLNLIEAIRAAGTRPHLIFVSSGGAVYGRTLRRRPFREDDQRVPSTSYGIQKLAGELYLRLAADHGWLTATALRVSNAYGVLLPIDRRQGFIGVAVNRVLLGQPVRVFGNLDNVRDYIHLEDLVHAVHLAVGNSESFRTYNIGSGQGRSVRDILSAIELLLGRAVDVEPEEIGMHLAPWSVLDISRAEHELGWRPKIDFVDGLRALLEQAAAPWQRFSV
jgi:UDP-glucose 4-epimerase